MKKLFVAVILSMSISNVMANSEVHDPTFEARIVNLEARVARLEINENRERAFCICKPASYGHYTLIRIEGKNETNLGQFVKYKQCNQMAMNCR